MLTWRDLMMTCLYLYAHLLKCSHYLPAHLSTKIGRGKILFLAIQPDSETLLAVHEYFGVSVPCRSLERETHATLLQRSLRSGFIVVVNMKPCSTVVPVKIEKGIFSTDKLKFSDLSTGEAVEAVTSGKGITVYVPVGGKDAAVVKVST